VDIDLVMPLLLAAALAVRPPALPIWQFQHAFSKSIYSSLFEELGKRSFWSPTSPKAGDMEHPVLVVMPAF
jgi:hypothetical protein